MGSMVVFNAELSDLANKNMADRFNLNSDKH